jgi:6-pyruvoyltetrahydropterin/6-carboxytetrahydropterin synthase
MAFEITATVEFSAGHQLKLYDGSMEPVHGHNWKVKVTVAAEKLDGMGVVMDFHELARLMEKVIEPMRNRHLNELAAFEEVNPSAENVAVWVGRGMKLPDSIMLVQVEVWETAEFSAIYRP